MNKYLIGLSLLITMFSCNNDDDGPFIEPLRERGPQAVVDNTILEDFLKTHTYNDLDFDNEDHTLTNNDIIFYKLESDLIDANKSSKQALINSNKLLRIPVKESGTEQILYVLQIREGKGRVVSRVDDVRMSFRGNNIINEQNITSIDSTLFQGSVTSINWVPLFLDNNNQNIPGLTVGLSQFKTASPINEMEPCRVFTTDSSTGESEIGNNDFGIGALFIPSGLGFYGNLIPGTGRREYNNLVYTFSLFNVDYRDHDGDGVLSRLELVDPKDPSKTFIEFDTDNDGLANFLDRNDDGDEKLTIAEIEILDNPDIDYDCDGIFNNDNEGLDLLKSDKDNNGILDFLDRDDDDKKIEEFNNNNNI